MTILDPLTGQTITIDIKPPVKGLPPDGRTAERLRCGVVAESDPQPPVYIAR